MSIDWGRLYQMREAKKATMQKQIQDAQERQNKLNDLFQQEIIKAQIKSRIEKEQYTEKIKMLKELGIFPGMGGQTTPGQTTPGGFRQPVGREPVFINKSSSSFDPLKGDISISSTPIVNPLFEAEQKRREIKRADISKRLEGERKLLVPTVQQKNDLLAVKQQINNINDMEKLATSVPSGFRGIAGIASSSLSRGKMSTNTRLYLKQLPAFAVSLYRALTGDTRLSDADAAARAYPLLWHPSEDIKIKTRSFSNIRKALTARQKLIESGRYKAGADGQFITPLEDVLAAAGVSGSSSISDDDRTINELLDRLEAK